MNTNASKAVKNINPVATREAAGGVTYRRYTRAMIEPTVTQNSALYFIQHKTPKERAGVLKRIGMLATTKRRRRPQSEVRGNVFRWPRIQWQA